MFLFFFDYSINFAESEYKEHKMLTWKAYSLTFIKLILIGVILSLIKKDFHPCWRLSLAVKFLGFSSWADRSEGCTTKEVQHSQPSLMLAICQCHWDNRYQECDYQLSLSGRAFWSVCAHVTFLPHKTIRMSPPYSNQRSYQMMMTMKWNYKEHKKHLNIKWSTAN